MTNDDYDPNTPPWLQPETKPAGKSEGKKGRNATPPPPHAPVQPPAQRPAPPQTYGPPSQQRQAPPQQYQPPQPPPAQAFQPPPPRQSPPPQPPQQQRPPVPAPEAQRPPQPPQRHQEQPRPQEQQRPPEPPRPPEPSRAPESRAPESRAPESLPPQSSRAPESEPPPAPELTRLPDTSRAPESEPPPRPLDRRPPETVQHERPAQHERPQPLDDGGPKEKSEIGSDGTVRRVPLEEDRAAQIYHAPAEPEPSGPEYTWAPPPQAPQHAPNAWQAPPTYDPQGSPQSVNDLSLLKRAKRPPRSGWRLALHKASGGSFNPGESNADIAYRELIERVNQPVRGDYRIAILSLKGGVGKTTTTVGIGSTFASQRGDRVIAIDANPDLGTLAHRVPQQTRSTVRDLLDDPSIHRYSDVRAHTSQAPSRLEILASEQDPAVSEAFSEADYRQAIGILQAYYNIILTDCGTGLMHSAMSGVLDMASSLVLVTSPAIDGARSASATLDWLEHHGYGRLVERTVVVVNAARRGSTGIDIEQLRKLFLDRTRAVQVVPFDDHLAEGAEIDLDLVNKSTRRALLELAAMVADDFAIAGGRQY